MKVTVEAQNTPNIWQISGPAQLRTFANQPFDTFHGQYIPKGSANDDDCYLPVDCDTSGSELEIPTHEIDSTEDSITNPNATYTSVLWTPKRGIIKPEFLANYRVPATLPNQTWPLLRLHKAARIPLRITNTYNSEQIETLIAVALTYLRTGSPTQIGMLALQDPALNPAFPVALGPNSPGVTRDIGLATLVAGPDGSFVDVVSAAFTPTCGIRLTGQDDRATGNLWPINKVDGAGFTIASSNGTDDGVVLWEIVEP